MCLVEMIQEERIKWTDQTNIDIKTIPPGIYFVQIQNEKGRSVKRFVKEYRLSFKVLNFNV